MTEAKLLDACALLFGPPARQAGAALLAGLSATSVRAAFRRLALRTHPDTAAGFADGARFIEASRAYELLMAFLLARGPAPRSGKTRRPAARAPQSTRVREIYYHGPLPRRRLRLAEFLYYSGYVSWQSLISALVLQRRGKQRSGEGARQPGIRRERRRPIGRYFVEKGSLTDGELSRLLRELFRHNARSHFGKHRGAGQRAAAFGRQPRSH